jgi:pimeloyl-ACP methyl ester carboxylesterase
MKPQASILALAALLAACTHLLVPSEAPQVREMDIGGTRLAYVEQGHGDAVVFVHGAAGDWRTWEPLRPHIATNYRFVSYSRRYHHPNPAHGDGAPYTVGQQADDLIAFVRGLAGGPVHAVGASAGGRILAEAALKQPELFKSLVLSEPLMARPIDPQALPSVVALVPEFGKVLTAARTGDTRQAAMQLAEFVYGEAGAWQRLPPERQQRFLDNAGTFVAIAAAPPTPPPPCERLGSYAMPVLVMEGEHTRPAFRATNDGLMHCLPKGSRRVVVPNAPHTWYPVNAEAGARRILDFISGVR